MKYGHRMMHHLDISYAQHIYNKVRRGLFLEYGRADEREIAADQYAIKLLGKERYLHDLKEIKNILIEKDAPQVAVWEITSRIQHLEEKNEK